MFRGWQEATPISNPGVGNTVSSNYTCSIPLPAFAVPLELRRSPRTLYSEGGLASSCVLDLADGGVRHRTSAFGLRCMAALGRAPSPSTFFAFGGCTPCTPRQKHITHVRPSPARAISASLPNWKSWGRHLRAWPRYQQDWAVKALHQRLRTPWSSVAEVGGRLGRD